MLWGCAPQQRPWRKTAPTELEPGLGGPSGEERNLAKVEVAGSKPVSRSNPLCKGSREFGRNPSNLRNGRLEWKGGSMGSESLVNSRRAHPSVPLERLHMKDALLLAAGMAPLARIARRTATNPRLTTTPIRSVPPGDSPRLVPAADVVHVAAGDPGARRTTAVRGAPAKWAPRVRSGRPSHASRPSNRTRRFALRQPRRIERLFAASQ